MKRSLKEIIDYKLECTDGEFGMVHDFLFDEDQWVVRYLVACIPVREGNRKVLVPTTALKSPDWVDSVFHLKINRDQMISCPTYESDLPVSKAYQRKIEEHYSKEELLNLYVAPPLVAPGITHVLLDPPIHSAPKIREKDIDSNLRSLSEIIGYRGHTTDGIMGEVIDLMVEDETWQICSIYFDTSRWLPWSRKVLLDVYLAQDISYLKREIRFKISSEDIKKAPKFDPEAPINKGKANRWYNFYGDRVPASSLS